MRIHGVLQDQVSLLTAHEFLMYKDIIPRTSEPFLLCTAWNTLNPGPYIPSVATVVGEDTFTECPCNQSFEIRPVCIFSDEVFRKEVTLSHEY